MKIGVAQLNLTDSIESNKKKILQYVEEAKRRDIEILNFPETALTGYIFDTFFEVNYEEVLSSIQEIKSELSDGNLHLILGTPYKIENNIYNSAVVLFPDGKQLVYNKNHLVSYETKYFKQGNERLLFNVKGHSFGVIVCRDQNFPELSGELKTDGARGIFICSAHYYNLIESKMKREKNYALPLARAYENNLWVFKSNAVGVLNGKISFGNSMIVDPRGIVAAKAGEMHEELLEYEINLDRENDHW